MHKSAHGKSATLEYMPCVITYPKNLIFFYRISLHLSNYFYHCSPHLSSFDVQVLEVSVNPQFPWWGSIPAIVLLNIRGKKSLRPTGESTAHGINHQAMSSPSILSPALLTHRLELWVHIPGLFHDLITYSPRGPAPNWAPHNLHTDCACLGCCPSWRLYHFPCLWNILCVSCHQECYDVLNKFDLEQYFKCTRDCRLYAWYKFLHARAWKNAAETARRNHRALWRDQKSQGQDRGSEPRAIWTECTKRKRRPRGGVKDESEGI